MNSILSSHHSKLSIVSFYSGCLLLIFGFRLVLLQQYGSSVPYFDDWRIGVFLHKYLDGNLTIVDWFTPAYQHQMLFSKTINLIFFRLNSLQWDPLNILVFNGLIWAVIGLIVIKIGKDSQKHLNSSIVIIGVLVLWNLPISIISATWAVVTNYYTMMLFLLLGYWGVAQRKIRPCWWFGFLALLACSFTIGAGVAVAIPPIIIYAFKYFWLEKKQQHDWLTLKLLLVTMILGFATTLLWQLAEGNTDHFKVTTIATFFSTLMKTVAWPVSDPAWLGLILQAPCLILFIAVIRKKIPLNPITIFTLSLAAYMLMQAFGIAYARNAPMGLNPAPRYYEFLLLSVVSNLISLLILLSSRGVRDGISSLQLFTVFWLAVLYISVPEQYQVYSDISTEELKRKENRFKIAREYIATRDVSVLEGHLYFRSPYPPSAKVLAQRLDDYSLAGTLPFELQIPNNLLFEKTLDFEYNGTILPSQKVHRAKYLGENVIGSFVLNRGAQNATGKFQSEVLRSTKPYLMIPTLGFLGLPGLELGILDLTTNTRHTIIPFYAPNTPEYWQNNYVKAPKSNYQIYAQDESSSLWFGFAAPREVGRISYFVRLLLEYRHWVWNLGFWLIVLSGLPFLFRIMGNRQ